MRQNTGVSTGGRIHTGYIIWRQDKVVNSSKGVFVKADNQLAEVVKKALVANGVKEKDIAIFDETKLQKDSLVAFVHEKTPSFLKLRIARVEDMENGNLRLVHEKEIESVI